MLKDNFILNLGGKYEKERKNFCRSYSSYSYSNYSGLLIARNSRRQANPNVGDGENEVVEEFVTKLEDGTRLNTSEQMKNSKRVEGVEISNIQVTEKDNVSLILGTATNVTDQVQNGFTMDVKIVDKQGNEIVKIGALVGKLEPGESTEFNTSATFDFANAYDFSVEKTGEYDG